jgi:hypothetical protein
VGQALGLCVGLVELGYQLQLGVAESLETGLELGLRVEWVLVRFKTGNPQVGICHTIPIP